ncbi:MAG: hypothetical protein H6818_06225 [Phycisphaerales bacterium]|nr:hypothetical protein [Phycisphaerales bacterium]MCB9862861.1 hypothetical protein [Phycisphaerales bacterium]
MTKQSRSGAIDMAKALVSASNGTLTLASAFEIANRGMASGLGFEQIGTVLDFVSKKAVTTGKSAGAAIDTVVTGLARGSTLFLDDFGILVDGLEGVKRRFDSLHGKNAFDALGPAAQKAETVRQALVEMRQQIGAIGVSGREPFFVFEGIKNSLRSSVQRMVAMVASSRALRTGLEGAQSLVQGITTHFEKGGGFGELLFGKKGGNGGGLLGLGGAVLIDLGKFIAKGFVGVVLKSVAVLIQGLPSAAKFFKDTIVPEIKAAIIEGAKEAAAIFKELLPKGFVDDWSKGANKIISARSLSDVGGLAKDLWLGTKYVTDKLFGSNLTGIQQKQVSMGPGVVPSLTPQGMLTQLGMSTALARVATDAEARAMLRAGGPVIDIRTLSSTPADAQKSIWGGLKSVVAESIGGAIDPLKKAMIVDKANGSAAIASNIAEQSFFGRMADKAIGALESVSQMPFVGKLNSVANNLLESSIGFDRSIKAFEQFKLDFPGKVITGADIPKPKPKRTNDDSDIPLTLAARRRQQRQLRMLDHDIALVEHGGHGARREALRRASERRRQLVAQGRDVSPSEWRRIRQEEFAAVVAEMTASLKQRRTAMAEALDADKWNRLPAARLARRERVNRQARGEIDIQGNPTWAGAAKWANDVVDIVQKQLEHIQRFSQTANLIVAALDGVSGELGTQRRRLAAVRR